MNELRISLIQSDLYWEDKEKNLSHFYRKLKALQGNSDLAVLPETFTTGFTMNPSQWAETNEGNTVAQLKSWAHELNLALCGSFIAREGQECFNRGFFITPEGDNHYYDKRHLFRMGEEHRHYASGVAQTTVSYLGWNIRLAICYDLRFPVWLRNRADKPYDLLIFSANWPKPRKLAWEILLCARAIENQCYVCGVNRIGADINHIPHSGNSAMIDYKGNILAQAGEDEETTITCHLNKEALTHFRDKFPAWADADRFEIIE